MSRSVQIKSLKKVCAFGRPALEVLSILHTLIHWQIEFNNNWCIDSSTLE